MITDPRAKKVGRIALNLKRLSEGLPNEHIARRFLANAVRLTRIVSHQPVFQVDQRHRLDAPDDYGFTECLCGHLDHELEIGPDALCINCSMKKEEESL